MSESDYRAEIIEACDHAAAAWERYISCAENERQDIWAARSRVFEKACEEVGAFYHEIGRLLRLSAPERQGK